MHCQVIPTVLKMTCREIGQAYNYMTNDMGSKLSGYYVSLQQRFGDPRVYASQKEEMQEQENRVMHRQSTRAADLLKDAYEARKQKNREQHSTRMSKHRGDQSVKVRLESKQEGQRQRQTSRPVKQQVAAAHATGPSDS